MVTWQMTSRDPKRSRSWPRYLWSLISRWPCEIHGRLILTTNRKLHIENPAVTWPMTSRDPKGQSLWPQYLCVRVFSALKCNFICIWLSYDKLNDVADRQRHAGNPNTFPSTLLPIGNTMHYTMFCSSRWALPVGNNRLFSRNHVFAERGYLSSNKMHVRNTFHYVMLPSDFRICIQ